MPYKRRRSFRRRRRKSYKRKPRAVRRRKRRSSRAGYSVPTGGRYKKLKFRYVESHSHAIAALTGIVQNKQTWNINSLFDPDLTGIGHQPLGFDNWAVFFSRYRVIGCNVNVKLTNTSDYAFYAVLQSRTTEDKAAPSTVFSTLIENNRGTIIRRLADHDAAGGNITINKYYSIATLFGTTAAAVMTDDKYIADFDASPVARGMAELGFVSQAHSCTVDCVTTLTFYTRMEVPTPVLAS